jgi:hypothetical protein
MSSPLVLLVLTLLVDGCRSYDNFGPGITIWNRTEHQR